MREGSEARAIRRSARAESLVPASGGAPHAPRPLSAPSVPPHPFMAPHGASCMHADPFTTNTYAWAGPLGHDPEVSSRAMGFLGGECPTVNFDSKGRIITVCVRDRRPSLVMLHPETLEVLDRYSLPKRNAPLLRMRKAMQDTSGGAYFYLDNLDRAVIGTADGGIEIVGVVEGPEGPRLSMVDRIELAPHIRRANGQLDKITAVLPDYLGNYWFVGRYGTVGIVTPERKVHVTHLVDEEIENSLSIAPEGAYVVSDHALYHFALPPEEGAPVQRWRELYDRGTRIKVGQINRGSGTTPTLLGDDYIAIADNAEPRMQVLVYRRKPELVDLSLAHGPSSLGRRAGHEAPPKRMDRLVCRTPVFSPGQSATENTLIGHGRSLIVENNAGYDIFRTMRRGKTSAPGIARIDVREDESGCDVVWESTEISQTTVPKLSAANGLIYVYTKLPNAPEGTDAYYFTAIDFETGRTAYRILTGTGVRYDNNWAAISLAPDGTAYVGVLNGLVRVRDSQPDGTAPYATGDRRAPSF
jgi:hypothetical protein